MSSAPTLKQFGTFNELRASGTHRDADFVRLVPGWTQEHMIYLMDGENYKRMQNEWRASRVVAAPAGMCACDVRAACVRRACGVRTACVR